MAERGTGGKILSLATKRARRVQEKMLQKLGKSDQTKDDVFQDFVNNFNRQSVAATKLQKEFTRFMNAIRTLNQCSTSLGETLRDLYEPTWAGCEEYKNIVQTRTLLWDDQIVSLQSKIVEPMNNYISKFPEVKNRIQKRERKVVDYDLRRRELEALKTKQKVTDQKLQQTEDSYSQAKQLYDEITDDLYEELPTFFDSRIQFYASVFQSLAATEARFHSEMTKVDEEFAGLMDGLASEAATAIHTTKKERTLDSTPKLLSRPGEEEDSDEGETPMSPPVFLANHGSHQDSPNLSPVSSSSSIHREAATTSKPDRPVIPPGDGSGSLRRQPPSKPTRSTSATEDNTGPADDSVAQQPQSPSPAQDADSAPLSPAPQSPQEPSTATYSDTQSPPQPIPHELSDADLAELDDVINLTENTPMSPPPDTSSEPTTGNFTPIKEPEDALYKVVATHPYNGEDEDELTFDKGEVIAVVPYEDNEDAEEGWSTGVILSSGIKGIFPDNFTKKLE